MHKKRALYGYEMRRMVWFLLAGVAASLLFTWILKISLEERVVSHGFLFWDSDTEMGAGFSMCFARYLGAGGAAFVIPPALAIMAIFQFRDMHNRKVLEYMHTLPFTESQRFCAKVGVGYGILTATALVAGIGILAVRSQVIDTVYKNALTNPYYKIILGNETLGHTLRNICLLWLILLAVYSIMVLVHAIVSKGVPASIIGIGIVLAPTWFWVVVREILVALGTHYRGELESWYETADYFGVLIGLGTGSESACAAGDEMLDLLVSYPDFGICAAICIGITVVCLAAAYAAVVRTDAARGGIVAQKYPARIFLGAGTALCFGTGIGMFLSYWFRNDMDLRLFIIVGTVSAIVIYVLLQKLFKLAAR